MPRITELVGSGRFVVTSELTPPKGLDLAPMLEAARSLAGFVDAFNLTDSHNARMSMAPIGAARRLLDEGIEPILQMTARDRNRIAIQADLLAAAALGVSNVVLMTGDAPAHGDHPDAKAVFDLGSVAIIETVRGLNEGRDLMGNALRGAPDLCIGAVVNPGNPNLDDEMARMAAKVEAGARFFQTQAVFDVAAFERFARRLERFEGVAGGGHRRRHPHQVGADGPLPERERPRDRSAGHLHRGDRGVQGRGCDEHVHRGADHRGDRIALPGGAPDDPRPRGARPRDRRPGRNLRPPAGISRSRGGRDGMRGRDPGGQR